MIDLNNISKTFYPKAGEVKALKNINLSVDTGEIVGVIGKSGAGKSTLIRCVNLLERPTSGTVTVAGQRLTDLKPAELRIARRHIGMIFQHFNLLSSKTVYENIALPLLLNNTNQKDKEIKSRVDALLALTGLSDKTADYPAHLSGGQKQRVAIARALATQPKILLCDEATSALDPHTTESILLLLKEINKQFNLTILLITHEMEVIKHSCDRVAVLDNGEIVEQDKVVNVFANPRTEIAKYFVQSSLKSELPAILQEKILLAPAENTVPVWRIYFRGRSAAEPVIAYLSRDLGLELNILQANIECIQHYTIGIMVASVMTKNNNFSAGLDYLHQKGLQVETVGYVSRDVI